MSQRLTSNVIPESSVVAARRQSLGEDRDTAIKMAAKRGHTTVVRMLLDIPNVDITIRSTTDGHTAMSAAQANGHQSIVKLLQDFELRNGVITSLPEIIQLSLHDEDGSDSDSDAYYDAEEGGDEDGTLGSLVSD
ncbi:hypothetical protein BKA70DRAFT_607498 [Coprinopsis sp. MPI-PUGE-AT-0042]|nr:hypothetical protein BKA70DRAFT_607498 [Coprinopsis sp. MPI-PUGE-AT-0042]